MQIYARHGSIILHNRSESFSNFMATLCFTVFLFFLKFSITLQRDTQVPAMLRIKDIFLHRIHSLLILGVVQHSSVPSFDSYPGYTSYNNIPVRTLDHHVHVQVPQPYPVPVTKQVTYPFPVPHAVEVPKPYYVRVPQPVHVTVNRPYPVEIPRPVPYSVPQYIRTSVPVIQGHQVNVETKANPVQDFFENTQSTFQNIFDNFQNPLQGFQNPFENFELPSLPLPAFPSVPFAPQQTQTTAPIADLSAPATTNSVSINNPTLKTTVTKTAIAQPAITTHHSKTIHAPSTVKDSKCTGCAISATNEKKEYVQPTDANGGYIY